MASDLVDRPRYVFDRNHQGASSQLSAFSNYYTYGQSTTAPSHARPYRSVHPASSRRHWDWHGDLAYAISSKTAHWQTDGFDISGDQYPSATWVSPNITIHEHDAFQPLLSEYHGKYDIVNLRFFITLLNGQILNQLLQNIMALLKPGGLFQWLDIDAPSVKPIGLEPASMTRTSLVATMMKNTPPDAALWITPNCDMATSAGFEAIAYDQLRLNDLHRPIWNQCVTMGLEEVIAGLEKRESGAESARAQEMRDILDHLSKEFRQGLALIRHGSTWWCGSHFSGMF